MKIVNNSEPFVVNFDGGDYNIPKGEFEVVNEGLGNHIVNKARKWNKNVNIISAVPINQVKPIDKIVAKPVKEVGEPPVSTGNAPAFGGATMETLPKKQGRPRKNAIPQVA